MSTLLDWSTTSADNANSDASITWAEGQNAGTVNGSARVMMARQAEWLADMSGSLVPGGTANALTITANSAYASAYETGITLVFKAASANTSGTVTLNVNSIGAKNIRKNTPDGEAALLVGDIVAGCIYTVRYSTALNGGAGGWLLSAGSLDNMTPAGVVVPFAGATEPAGWLFSYGQAVSRTTYARLFAAISTAFGTGDGSTTFNLPDLRGRVVAGKDDMGGSSANRLTDQSGGLDGDVLGDTGGAETHTLTSAQIAAHLHAVSLTTSSSGSHDHDIPYGSNFPGGVQDIFSRFSSTSGGTDSSNIQSAGAHTHSVSGNTANTGDGGAHNNVQPTIILNSIIKF